jgi:GPH family glycoside/pentoside/hexuronide:cation symporter
MALTPKAVPYSYKLAFGFGMLANQMFPAVLSAFAVVLVQDLGFPGWMWGVVFFFPRIFDAFSDPIMGFISDNTRSKWGRRRQYVFIGSILMGISFIVLWQLYAENSLMFNFLYFMGFSVFFFLGITIFSVPYVAMGYEMSYDFHERTQIMAIAQWIGQWAWVIAPWFWVIIYNPDQFGFEDAVYATRKLAFFVGILFMICAMVPALVIKSESTEDRDDYTPIKISNLGTGFSEIITGFKEAFKIPDFRRICIAIFLIFNAFQTIAAFTFFVIVYHLFGGDAEAAGYWPTLFGSLGALVTTFIVIPVVAKMSSMIGKRKAFLLSQSISIFGYVLFWFLLIPGKPFMFIFALPFFSFGIGGLFTLMMSMTADVIDLDELTNGNRREGIFGAIYWWMTKFGYAIAGGLSGLILSVVGFSADALPGPIPIGDVWPGITGLRAFFSGLPIVGTAIAILVMRNYTIDEAKANEIRSELENRKVEKTSNIEPLPYYEKTKLLELISKDIEIDEEEIDFSGKSEESLNVMFKSILNRGIHGMCFSPYLEGQKIGDKLSRQQIIKRMQIITPHTNWIRSFSTTDGNEYIPEIAKSNHIQTMVGAWIDGNKEKNEREIENLIRLAKSGYVDIATVGNETLLRKDSTEVEIIQYIQRVKQAIPNVPVAYVDTYYQLINNPKILEYCDLVLANCYPFWEGYHINDAFQYLKQMHGLINRIANGKRVIITETG